MKILKHYQLKLTFSGPFISQASGTIPLGLDAAMQYHQQQPVINGSLIKGNLRHTLSEFAILLDDSKLKHAIDRWFGQQSEKGEYTPQRTHVDFDFFWVLAGEYQPNQQQRTRIAINSTTGTVQEGAMQVVEDCFPVGSDNPVFTGKISARFADNKERKQFEKWLNKALDYIPAIGSFKGVGWGKLVDSDFVPVADDNRPNSTPLSLKNGATRVTIQLDIDRAFCLGRPRTPDSNQIVSTDFIPGNVLKGLIARLYDNKTDVLQSTLCFNKLIITHAMPAKKPSRNRVIPLSMAMLHDKAVDMASVPIQGQVWHQAPIFAPDWKEKDRQKISQALTQEANEPNRLLVLRTQINEKGISEQGKLFSLECVDPTGYLWCADIELCNIPAEKRQAVLSELQEKLNQGLSGIGKTKAHATVTFDLSTPKNCEQLELTAGRQTITLNTAARMLPTNFRSQGTNSASTLRKAYLNYWREALEDNTLTLEIYFAQQSLSSSYYHQRQHEPEKNSYHPEWLSTAGSVFVLNIDNQKTLQKLQQFVKTGIPAHPEIDGNKDKWNTTPYLPEHGYGEIMMNDPQQLALNELPEELK